MQTMLILTAKDEGSMHRKAYLDEVRQFFFVGGIIDFFGEKYGTEQIYLIKFVNNFRRLT